MHLQVEHYLQVVKSEVMTRSSKIVEEYEYTAHSSLVHSVDIPVAKFHFEPSPMQVLFYPSLCMSLMFNCSKSSRSLHYLSLVKIQVLISVNSKSFAHFITNVCAIIGGVFTVGAFMPLHVSYYFFKKSV